MPSSFFSFVVSVDYLANAVLNAVITRALVARAHSAKKYDKYYLIVLQCITRIQTDTQGTYNSYYDIHINENLYIPYSR